jgi:hypothetical protein
MGETEKGVAMTPFHYVRKIYQDIRRLSRSFHERVSVVDISVPRMNTDEINLGDRAEEDCPARMLQRRGWLA